MDKSIGTPDHTRTLITSHSKYIYDLQMENTASNKQKCREELRKSESTEEDFFKQNAVKC